MDSSAESMAFFLFSSGQSAVGSRLWVFISWEASEVGRVAAALSLARPFKAGTVEFIVANEQGRWK
jgi:hypothetical protein